MTPGDRHAGGHIVVVGQWREGGEGRIPVPYAEAVAAAGGVPRVFSTFDAAEGQELPEGLDAHFGLDPDDDSALDGAAGLLLPGGGDIDPAFYGRPRHPRTHNVNHRRDRYELTLLATALERDVPVLAICHGMQLLNVHMGGTLIQHLGDRDDVFDHDDGYPASEPRHGLRIRERSSLARYVGSSRIGVNSHHHQGIDDVAPGLDEVAWSDDGLLEGVVSHSHSWVVGVQWHPEVMAAEHEAQARLFEAFVDAAHNSRLEVAS
jgi:putative glutamine amidotransferase